jgi:hypothetical protein
MAFAEILLPEGRTVEQIVREAATKALAEKGYAVVAEESPEFAQALPVNIEIQQFWSWFTPGVLPSFSRVCGHCFVERRSMGR